MLMYMPEVQIRTSFKEAAIKDAIKKAGGSSREDAVAKWMSKEEVF